MTPSPAEDDRELSVDAASDKDADTPRPSLGTAAQQEPLEDRPTRHPLAVPIIGIFIILLVQALTHASAFLLPVTAAVLGYLVLNAPRRTLERLGLPSPLIAAVFTLTLGGIVAIAVTVLAEPVGDFVADLPTLLDQALALLTGPGGMLEPFSQAAEATEQAMSEAGAEPVMPVEVVSSGGFASSIFSAAPGLLGQVVFAMCLLYFLVASGDLFIQKALQSADRFQDKRATLRTVRAIERGLGNYLGAIALINIGLGVCIGAAMWLWGLPNPWLVGMMATVLNFVPFVGAVIGSIVAGIIGFITFGDMWTGLAILATYYGLTAFEGQFLTPTLVGQRLRLNATMVFLSVAFFAWIWSVMGMVVAVPLLIVVKVVCDTVPRFRKIGLFLGDAEGFVRPDDREANGG